jgi:hypothetical protein
MPDEAKEEARRLPKLEDLIFLAARELHNFGELTKTQFEWFKAHANGATKADLEAMEKRLTTLISGIRPTTPRARFDWAVGPVLNK